MIQFKWLQLYWRIKMRFETLDIVTIIFLILSISLFVIGLIIKTRLAYIGFAGTMMFALIFIVFILDRLIESKGGNK